MTSARVRRRPSASAPSSTACGRACGGVEGGKRECAGYPTAASLPPFPLRRLRSDLTVREHLYFYARLKGVPLRRLAAAVQTIAEKTGLDGDSFGLVASALSGGQRRRLSCGIALMGDPAVLVWDEPSTVRAYCCHCQWHGSAHHASCGMGRATARRTAAHPRVLLPPAQGLDPAARRDIWRIVQSEKAAGGL